VDQRIDDPAEETGDPHQLDLPNEQLHPSIHLIRVPDRETRKRAFRVLIATDESWVRLPGNVMGVSTRQVEAMKKHQVSFDWVSQAPSNA
jgi:hypothetical protein